MAKFRNEKLAKSLAGRKVKPNLKEAVEMPKPNTVNRQGHSAYKLDKRLRLLTMLNTLKLQNQYYRTDGEAQRELKQLVDECAKENAYFVAQAIVYSRCVGEGMRSVNHLAASYLAPHCAGHEWAKRFYSLWDKRTKSGGTIFRADDMSEIVACFTARNNTSVTNAMKKGFKDALEHLDSYALLKYKKSLIDVINLVHPNPNASEALVKVGRKNISTLSAIMKGENVSADTWEVANSDAGQVVKKAVDAGKIDKEDAAKVLKEAKADNWDGLLSDGKLGVLAALRNIRSMLNVNASSATVDKLCALLSNAGAIRNGKVMPYQIDLAHSVAVEEFSSPDSRKIAKALLAGYEAAVPNLAEMLPGRNLVMVDISGSMNNSTWCPMVDARTGKKMSQSTPADKASLIAATIAKATSADVIRFGTSAEIYKYNPNADVFSIANGIRGNMGGTYLAKAWDLATKSGVKYDRVFILSDNEANRGNTYAAYNSYVKACGGPYVYSVDLAGYGTAQVAGDKVRYYYGYGYSMFDDVAKSEFNPNYHLDKVKKIVI